MLIAFFVDGIADEGSFRNKTKPVTDCTFLQYVLPFLKPPGHKIFPDRFLFFRCETHMLGYTFKQQVMHDRVFLNTRNRM